MYEKHYMGAISSHLLEVLVAEIAGTVYIHCTYHLYTLLYSEYSERANDGWFSNVWLLIDSHWLWL